MSIAHIKKRRPAIFNFLWSRFDNNMLKSTFAPQVSALAWWFGLGK